MACTINPVNFDFPSCHDPKEEQAARFFITKPDGEIVYVSPDFLNQFSRLGMSVDQTIMALQAVANEGILASKEIMKLKFPRHPKKRLAGLKENNASVFARKRPTR